MAQLEVSKPEPTKSLFVFEGLKLFDHNFIVFKKRLSLVIFQNFSVFSIKFHDCIKHVKSVKTCCKSTKTKHAERFASVTFSS